MLIVTWQIVFFLLNQIFFRQVGAPNGGGQPQQQQQQQQVQAAGGGAGAAGTADYSKQWAEYYRSMGKIEEAEAIENQIKATKVCCF